MADDYYENSYNNEPREITISYFSGWWEDILIPAINQEGFSGNMNNSLLDKAVAVVNSIVNGLHNDNRVKIYPAYTLLLIYKNKYLIRKLGTGNIFIRNKTISRLTEENSWLEEFIRANILTHQEGMLYKKRKAMIECKGNANDSSLIKKQGYIRKKIHLLFVVKM